MIRLKLVLALLMMVAWFSFDAESSDAQLFRNLRSNNCCQPRPCRRPMMRRSCCPQPVQQCCPQPVVTQPCCGGAATGTWNSGTPGIVTAPGNQYGKIPGQGGIETCQEAYTACMSACGTNCAGPMKANCESYCLCVRQACNGTTGPCTQTAPPCLGGAD